MKYVTKFFEKTFKAVDEEEKSKDVYLSVSRWLAENIISKVEIGEVFWKVEKVVPADLPTFKLEFYVMLEDTELEKSFCKRCQEFHSLFYLNQQYNCDACNMQAYRKQADEKLKVKKQFRKEQLARILYSD